MKEVVKTTRRAIAVHITQKLSRGITVTTIRIIRSLTAIAMLRDNTTTDIIDTSEDVLTVIVKRRHG